MPYNVLDLIDIPKQFPGPDKKTSEKLQKLQDIFGPEGNATGVDVLLHKLIISLADTQKGDPDEEESKKLVKKFRQFIEQEDGMSYGDPDFYREFASRECETLLDAAIIKRATRWQLVQNENLDLAEETAKMLFGNNSKVEKRLEEYMGKSSIGHLKGDIIAPASAYLIIASIGLILFILKRSDWQINKDDAMLYVMFLTSMLTGIAFANLASYIRNHPETTNKKYMSNLYGEMEIPDEVEQFASLTLQIRNKVRLLEILPNCKKRTTTIRKLQPMLDEAEIMARTHKQLLCMPMTKYRSAVRPVIDKPAANPPTDET